MKGSLSIIRFNILLCFLSISSLRGQQPIVSASMIGTNDLQLQNQSELTLRLLLRDEAGNARKIAVVTPGQAVTIGDKWSRQLLRRTKVQCDYDVETIAIDLAIMRETIAGRQRTDNLVKLWLWIFGGKPAVDTYEALVLWFRADFQNTQQVWADWLGKQVVRWLSNKGGEAFENAIRDASGNNALTIIGGYAFKLGAAELLSRLKDDYLQTVNLAITNRHPDLLRRLKLMHEVVKDIEKFQAEYNYSLAAITNNQDILDRHTPYFIIESAAFYDALFGAGEGSNRPWEMDFAKEIEFFPSVKLYLPLSGQAYEGGGFGRWYLTGMFSKKSHKYVWDVFLPASYLAVPRGSGLFKPEGSLFFSMQRINFGVSYLVRPRHRPGRTYIFEAGAETFTGDIYVPSGRTVGNLTLRETRFRNAFSRRYAPYLAFNYTGQLGKLPLGLTLGAQYAFLENWSFSGDQYRLYQNAASAVFLPKHTLTLKAGLSVLY